MSTLFDVAGDCLALCDPEAKIAATIAARRAWDEGALGLEPAGEAPPIGEPGRPPRPLLVAHTRLPKRKPGSVQGRAALIHAIAHIEFNAINLAWDAVYRFRAMPRDYYADWIRVAGEESSHFRLLAGHLGTLGFAYGDFEAHNGLWEMARKTAHDALVRMALVPRVLEARGLDVTPGMIERLRRQGDAVAVSILELILREEIGHVAIGSRWYHYLCRQRRLEPAGTFRRLLGEYMRGHLKGPFNVEARLAAGFDAEELEALAHM